MASKEQLQKEAKEQAKAESAPLAVAVSKKIVEDFSELVDSKLPQIAKVVLPFRSGLTLTLPARNLNSRSLWTSCSHWKRKRDRSVA